MGNDNILIVVLAAIAYIFFIQPSTGAKPKEGERYCPKGERYPATEWDLLFGCREGYDRKLFGDDCVCTAQAPTSIPDAAHSPQTPAPTPTKCPWDSSLLIGDRRCGTQRIDYPTTPTGCMPGEYYLDIPTGVFQRCPG